MRQLILCSLLFLMTTPVLRADDTTPKAAPTGTALYRVAADDVLDISVQDHAELSKTAAVLPDGTISYPYVGDFKASGLTLREIQDRITSVLSKEIASPNVTVTIKTLHERPASHVSVLGHLRSNGKFTLKEGWHVLDLIIEAGGLPAEPNALFAANLVRNNTSIPLELNHILAGTDPKANILLMPDDVLNVTEYLIATPQVQVLGEVVRPGSQPLTRDGSIVAVLSAVGGPTPGAALSQATITHEGKTTTVDLRSYKTSGQVAANLKLEPGDTLFIPLNQTVYYVYGSVGHPGVAIYPDIEKIDALKALTIAGGQTQDANLKAVAIIHPAKDGKSTLTTINLEKAMKQGDLSNDVVLQPGDLLFIPPRHKGNPLNMSNVFSALSFAGLLGLGL